MSDDNSSLIRDGKMVFPHERFDGVEDIQEDRVGTEAIRLARRILQRNPGTAMAVKTEFAVVASRWKRSSFTPWHLQTKFSSTGVPNRTIADFKRLSFILASCVVGPDVERLAAMVGIPRDAAADWGENLRRNAVWKEDKVDCDPWNEEEGGLSLYLTDTLVAKSKSDAEIIEWTRNSVMEAAEGINPGDRD